MTQGSLVPPATPKGKITRETPSARALRRKAEEAAKVVSVAVEDLPGNMKAPIVLARYGYPLNTTRMRRVLHKLGVSNEEFIEWSGWTLTQWIAANKGWSERAFEVLLVENLDHVKAVRPL